MRTLHVSVEASLYDTDSVGGTTLIGNIYATAGPGGLRDVLIPVGPGVTPAVFDLAPGPYMVEVLLPSGLLLTEDVEVTDDDDHNEVIIGAADSPHESHAWQYLAGNLEPAKVYRSPTEVPVPRSRSSRAVAMAMRTVTRSDAGELPMSAPGDFDLDVELDMELEIDEPTSAGALPRPAIGEIGWFPDPDPAALGWASADSLRRIGATPTIGDVADALGLGSWLDLTEPTQSDGISHLYRFAGDGPVDSPASAATGLRQFAWVDIGERPHLVTLPLPWTDPDQNDVVVEMMVSERQHPSGSSVAVTVRDRRLGPALAYLANGSFTGARAMFSSVEDLLFGKVMNQLAAAAGGYVMVGASAADDGAERWHGWIENLSSWFSWLPDGAILLATLRLRQARTQTDLDTARETLLEAWDRGLPVYTLGLRWLIDGLQQFEFDDDGDVDAEIQQRLDLVRRVAWSADMRQPFLVLRLGEGST